VTTGHDCSALALPKAPRAERQRWGLLLLAGVVAYYGLTWVMTGEAQVERAPATLFFQWDPTFAYTSTCETVTVMNRPEYHLTGFRCWAGQTVQNPYRADLFLVDKVVVRWIAKHDDAPPCWRVTIGKWGGRACPDPAVTSRIWENRVYTSSIELPEPGGYPGGRWRPTRVAWRARLRYG